MYCISCGAEIPEGSEFCFKCGASQTEPQTPVYAAQPLVQAPVAPTNVLTWGIIGLAFACTFFGSFLGIIFSAIGMKKHRAYLSSGAEYSTKVKVGGILSKVGLGVGIALTVLCVLYFIFIIVMIAFIGREIDWSYIF
ncbi:MAG: zinc ribbon domain-containing protein [Oscillospiraceae bacterium]|nr:zinc ribbon domain-containing protein [Oscillospiraceae bacterium]